MSAPLTPDLCVIGAGAAGLTVAAGAAALGASVVLVERGAMGGECLNTGCVPSKALIASARRAHEARQAAGLGVLAGHVIVDFAAVMARVHAVIAEIAPTDSEARFSALGVKVIRAEARFTDARTVEAGGTAIRARRFVIATGSRPALPPIEGLSGVPFLTNETVFDLTELPRRLLILGGGAVGLELAQAFRRLGSRVELVEAGEPLAREDPELVAPLLARLREEGVVIHARARALAARASGDGVALTLDGGEAPRTMFGSHLLVAAGRTPALDGLGLKAAGVRLENGRLRLTPGLRTTNRRVYAAGDAAGAGLTHVAGYQAGLVLRAALFALPVRFDAAPLPRAVFTDPEIASVGLSEADARRRRKGVQVFRWPFGENDRARAEGRSEGHVKLVTDAGGKILGAGIVGEGAGEQIHLLAAAVQKRWSVSELATLTLPYPTRGEAAKRAALIGAADRLTNPWVGRIIRFVRRLP